MRAARFARGVGGFAAAFGVSVVFAHATATADSDTGTADPSSAEASAQSESAVRPRGGPRPASAVEPESSPAPARGRRVGTVPGLPDNPAAATVSASAATAAYPAAGLAVPPVPSAQVATSTSSRPMATATTATPYGVLGEWMLKPDGQVADWGGRPYCGKGSSAANCKADTAAAKTLFRSRSTPSSSSRPAPVTRRNSSSTGR
jgi:hypothetical protein